MLSLLVTRFRGTGSTDNVQVSVTQSIVSNILMIKDGVGREGGSWTRDQQGASESRP